MRARNAGWRGVVIVIMCEALSEKMLFIVGMNIMEGNAVGKISMLVRFRGLSNSKSAKICVMRKKAALSERSEFALFFSCL